jgi:Na+/phosphate symporter
MATIAIPLAFAILGALIYALSSKNSPVNRMGEITFFVGMFWLCAKLSGQALHF